MQRFNSLPLAFRALAVVVALGISFVLAAGIAGVAASTFGRFSGFLGVERTQQGAQETAPTSEGEYLAAIERIQAGSVESFLESKDEFSRYDSVTSDDLEKMKNDYNDLGDYLGQVDNLTPPEKYRDQHELFRSAIDDLYRAAGLAYSLAAEPSSLTRSDLDQYDLYSSRAASRLRQSNQILGQNYKTIEGVQKGNLTGSSTTTVKGTTVAQLFGGSKERYVNVHAKTEGREVPPGIACADLAQTAGGSTTGEESRELELTPSRDSGVSGTATFEDAEDGVKVTLNIQGPLEGGVEHLAHIHEGATCKDERNDQGGPVEFPLNPVKVGLP